MQPIESSLRPLVPTYHYVCTINSYLLTYAASIANTITDFLTTLIPVTLVGKLHLPYRQRIAIMGLFALGATVNIAGRFVHIHAHQYARERPRSFMGWMADMHHCSLWKLDLEWYVFRFSSIVFS